MTSHKWKKVPGPHKKFTYQECQNCNLRRANRAGNNKRFYWSIDGGYDTYTSDYRYHPPDTCEEFNRMMSEIMETHKSNGHTWKFKQLTITLIYYECCHCGSSFRLNLSNDKRTVIIGDKTYKHGSEPSCKSVTMNEALE